MEEKTKEKVNRKDYWLHEGIIVKVVTKKLGDKYYKKKAVIRVRHQYPVAQLMHYFLYFLLSSVFMIIHHFWANNA